MIFHSPGNFVIEHNGVPPVEKGAESEEFNFVLRYKIDTLGQSCALLVYHANLCTLHKFMYFFVLSVM